MRMASPPGPVGTGKAQLEAAGLMEARDPRAPGDRMHRELHPSRGPLQRDLPVGRLAERHDLHRPMTLRASRLQCGTSLTSCGNVSPQA